MRIDVRKCLFVGLESERIPFFERAQRTGVIQFIDSHDRPRVETPSGILKIVAAIRVVQGLPVVEQEDVGDLDIADAVAKNILDLKHREEKLLEERRMLRQEHARVEVFGSFSLDDVAYIEEEGNRVVQFFCARKGTAADLDAVAGDYASGFFHVGTEHGLDYFMSIQQCAVAVEGMMEMRLEHNLDDLEKRIEEVNAEIADIDAALKVEAKYNNLLHQALLQQKNVHSLQTAVGYVNTVAEDRAFAVEGWIPENKEEELARLLEDCDVHAEEIAIDADNQVPTYLENSGTSAIGEDLVHIYDTPATSDDDPSPWVLWSFALFFAIILGDGGYGFLFLALTAFLYYKFPKIRGMGRRMLRLSAILSVSCVLWGVATNSFFGISLDIGHPLRQVSALQWLAGKKADYHFAVKDDVFEKWTTKYPALAAGGDGSELLSSAVKTVEGTPHYEMLNEFTDNILLEFALFLGVLHISLSFLRYIRRSPAGLGWVAFMIGAYLYVPSYLNATSMMHFWWGLDKTVSAEAGHHLAVGGFCLAIGLAVIKDKLLGILEVANLIQVFADVLSYLRLYALGLAGGIVSATVNEMAGSVAVVFGVIILVIGHIVNIALSLMGGVIHGLRLNFIEWYHYSFDGGGKVFSPLKLLRIESTD